MGDRPVTTAVERFKKRLADAIERVCVLEAKLEEAYAEIARRDAVEQAKTKEEA